MTCASSGAIQCGPFQSAAFRRESSRRAGLAFCPVSKRGGRPDAPTRSSRITRCGSTWRLRLTLAATRPSHGMRRPKSTFASRPPHERRRIERLATILGLTDTEATGGYGHLRVELFPEEEFNVVRLNRPNTRPHGTVSGTNGGRSGEQADHGESTNRKITPHYNSLRP